MISKVLITAFAASLLPVWRGAGHSRFDGVNLWYLLQDSSLHLEEGPFGCNHIPYNQAVLRARAAYQKKLRQET